MKKINLILLLCMAYFGLNAEVLKKWNWKDEVPPKDISLRGKAAIRDINGTQSLTVEDGYDFATLFFNAQNHELRLICSGMSLPDNVNASIGAIVFRYDGAKWQQVKNIGWKRVLPLNTPKEIVFTISAEDLKPGRHMVILYRNSGKAALQEIRLEKPAEDDPAFDPTRKNAALEISAPETRRYQYPAGRGDNMTLTYFPVGVYLYADSLPDMDSLRKAFAELRDAGVNTVHYAGNVGEHPAKPWTHTLKASELAEQYGLKLWVQMNDVYYRYDGHPLIQRMKLKNSLEFVHKFVAPRLNKSLPPYQGRNAVYAWSPSEENPPSSVKPLAEYRKLIWDILPEARVFELFTNLKTLQDLEHPWPNIAGIDRYPFMYSARGGDSRLWLPNNGLKWFAGAIRPFFNQAQKMGLPMIGVIQGCQIYTFYPPAEMTPGINDPALLAAYTVPAAPGMRYYPEHNKFGRWSMYSPSTNGIHAQSWTAVCEGAKGILIYAYSPFSHQEQMEHARKQIAAGGHVNTVSLSVTHPGWENMKKTFAELTPWSKLFLALEKQDNKLLDIKEPDVLCNFFKDPAGGEYAIVVNLRLTGHAAAGLQPTLDEDGALINLPPALPRAIDLNSSLKIVDLAMEKQITSVILEPGQGKILLLGEKRSSSDVINEYKAR